MYCAIRDYQPFDFTVKDYIKENILNYTNYSILEILELTKEEMQFTFTIPEGYSLDENELDEMDKISQVRKNVSFMFYDRIPKSLSKNVKYFYAFLSGIRVDCLEKLYALGEEGVSQAYITGALGFEMDKARVVADKFGMSLRVVPNMAQVSGFTLNHTLEGGNVTSFYIRPEDLELYEPYIDVVEFICLDEKQSVFHEIYFVEKEWITNLGIIIAGLETLYNDGVPRMFTETRLNCGKKCLTDKCHSCFKYAALAEMLYTNNLRVKNKEEVINMEEED